MTNFNKAKELVTLVLDELEIDFDDVNTSELVRVIEDVDFYIFSRAASFIVDVAGTKTTLVRIDDKYFIEV